MSYIGRSDPQGPKSTLENRSVFCRDNLEVLHGIGSESIDLIYLAPPFNKKLEVLHGIDSESIDLIYLDPPFNKKKEFTAPVGSRAEGAGFHDHFGEKTSKKSGLGTRATNIICAIWRCVFWRCIGCSRTQVASTCIATRR